MKRVKTVVGSTGCGEKPGVAVTLVRKLRQSWPTKVSMHLYA